jgi:hypothetical protein
MMEIGKCNFDKFIIWKKKMNKLNLDVVTSKDLIKQQETKDKLKKWIGDNSMSFFIFSLVSIEKRFHLIKAGLAFNFEFSFRDHVDEFVD